MNWEEAWERKAAIDAAEQEYEENLAWAAFCLWFRRILIVVLVAGALLALGVV